MQIYSKEECLIAARSALKAFPINPTHVELISHSENHTFHVRDSKDSSFVLRIHRPEYHTLEELQSEHLWTEALRATGIDVPVFVKTKECGGYTSVTLGGTRRYAGMLEWVEGEPLSHLIDSEKDLTVLSHWYSILGELIATLHEHAVDWSIPENFTRHSFDLDGFAGENPFWGRYWEAPVFSTSQRQNLSSFRKLICEVLQKCDERSDAFSLIHADLHPYNVIVNLDRLHIIDFDDAGFGWHAYDLAVAIYYERGSEKLDSLLAALITGYQRVRPIADETVNLIPLFFMIRNLASIGWISARPDLRRDVASICKGLYEDTCENIDDAITRSGL